MRTISNIRVGKAKIDPSAPSHVSGVRQGNQPGSYEKQAGNLPDGRATMARSTGINADARGPIDPRSPVLPPP